MVSRKGYWNMINEHIVNSDLEYLETKNIEEKRKELKQAQREIEQDPNVQSLVEAFGAKVVVSSIEPRTEK